MATSIHEDTDGIVEFDVTIDGVAFSQTYGIRKITINQHFNDHHNFELIYADGDAGVHAPVKLNDFKNFLGQSITIAVRYGVNPPRLTFKGLITNVKTAAGHNGDIYNILTGYSPTILLDNGEHNNSFLEQTLDKIFKDTCSSIASNVLSLTAEPLKRSVLPYVTQYRETNFAFLRRLAAEYGEWFYYDGTALRLGNPKNEAKYSLTVGMDAIEFGLNLKLAPLAFSQTGYLSKNDKLVEANSSGEQVSGLDPFGKFAFDRSERMFSQQASTLATRNFVAEAEAKEAVKIAKATAAAGLFVATGKAYMGLEIGKGVEMHAGTEDYGAFTVVKLTHVIEDGDAVSTFEAVPSSLVVVPNSYYKKPIAEPQLGVVTSNEDPDNMGRVQVRLLWQESNQNTPFIGVLSPSGGIYQNGDKTRGMFFTPEVNDYVVVGFTQSDPDRPFVMGSLPHGKAIDSSKNTDNTIKSISTKSGNIITFQDKDKDQEIKIQTDDTNYISINFKNSDGSIKVFSSKSIEVNSKEEIIIKSGKTINVQGDKTITIKSENINIEATDSISLKANKKVEIKAPDVAIEGNKGVEVKAGATLKLSGAQTELAGTATTKVAGAMLNLEGSAMTNLKGGIVKIN